MEQSTCLPQAGIEHMSNALTSKRGEGIFYLLRDFVRFESTVWQILFIAATIFAATLIYWGHNRFNIFSAAWP
jgi:hypothetical protein